METYAVENAQHRMHQLLSDAHQGKTVVIAAENGWAATLVPIPLRAKQARQAGSARGQGPDSTSQRAFQFRHMIGEDAVDS